MGSDVRVPRLLTLKQVEELTGIKRWRLYTELRASGLPHLKIGKTYRVPEDGLCNWISEQSKPRTKEEG
jgi:excisionase family DNA binding protein